MSVKVSSQTGRMCKHQGICLKQELLSTYLEVFIVLSYVSTVPRRDLARG